jgi:hypothetical protein
LLAWLTNRIASRQLHIDYAWSSFFGVIALIFALFGIGQLTTAWPQVWRITVRFLLVASYLPLLFLFRIVSLEELQRAGRMVREKLGNIK